MMTGEFRLPSNKPDNESFVVVGDEAEEFTFP